MKTSVNRYIELTSANRDRVRHPYPSQFTTELCVSNSGRITAFNSKDPVFSSVNVYPPPNGDISYPNVGFMYGVNVNSSGVASSLIMGLIPVVQTSAQETTVIPLSTESGAYVGDTLELVSHTVGGTVIASNEYRTITDYQVRFEQSVSTTIDAVQPILTNSVPLTSMFAGTIDNYFVGWTITFAITTDANLRNETRIITYYRAYDKRVFFDRPVLDATITAGDTVVLSLPGYQATIDSPFSVGALPLNNFSSSANTTFRIRRGTAPPTTEGTIVSGTTTTFTLPASAGTVDYSGSTIWISTNPTVYSGALVSASFASVGGTQTQGIFTLDSGASVFATNFLTGMTIQMTSGAFSGGVYFISAWDSTTLTGRTSVGWTSLVAGTTNPSGGDTFIISQPSPSIYRLISNYNPITRVGTVTSPFSYVNQQGTITKYAVSSSDTFEILQFSQDNYQPLDYAESTVHQQQPHCYEIELTSLTLPNVPLSGGQGGGIANYPYVYVEFRNITQGTSAYDFNTNNPLARNVMFKAPIIFNYQLAQMKFIVSDGHGMVQTLKFKPSDALSFSVFLPNGELLIPIEPDYVGPSSPNPALQITACFSVKRMG